MFLNVCNYLFIHKNMKNMILLASKNKNKVLEIRAIFAETTYIFKTLDDFHHITEPEESGKSFKENAQLKAVYYFENFGLPVIADDSGLVVPALNGEPGILSARYAGAHKSYQDNNQKLLHRMRDLRDKQREAFFVCYAVYMDNDVVISAEGRVSGIITDRPRGTNGFGYDPLFLKPEIGRTFAELSPSDKNKISHRYMALVALNKKLEKYWNK
jgi:non-canonical purine NTP pyrophosphatase (RdgB/HAM1 family)